MRVSGDGPAGGAEVVEVCCSLVKIVVGRGLGSKSLPIVGVAGGRTVSISGGSFMPVLSGGGFVRVVNGPEQSVELAAELLGCVEPRCGQRLAVEDFEGEPGSEEGLRVGEPLEALVGGGHVLLPVASADTAAPAHPLGREEAGPVVVEEGREVVLQEGADPGREVFGHVPVAEPLSDDAAVL